VDEHVSEFANSFQRFMESMSRAAGDEKKSPVRELVDSHLGVDSSLTPVVADSFPPYDHVNLQVAMSAYLGGEERTHELVGLTGQQRHYSSLSDLLDTAHMMACGSARSTW